MSSASCGKAEDMKVWYLSEYQLPIGAGGLVGTQNRHRDCPLKSIDPDNPVSWVTAKEPELGPFVPYYSHHSREAARFIPRRGKWSVSICVRAAPPRAASARCVSTPLCHTHCARCARGIFSASLRRRDFGPPSPQSSVALVLSWPAQTHAQTVQPSLHGRPRPAYRARCSPNQ